MIVIRQGTPKHTQWLFFHTGEQPFKRVEEKGKLLRCENLNYHTSKSLAEAEGWFSFPNSEEKKSFKKMSLGMDCGGELE